jgi:hypothetical protein
MDWPMSELVNQRMGGTRRLSEISDLENEIVSDYPKATLRQFGQAREKSALRFAGSGAGGLCEGKAVPHPLIFRYNRRACLNL